ncbi:MAG: hypothetical protein IPI37_02730 [Bacteroidales bacterium]|nr:hypothetical protein [Bacteroidales bacterium]
MNFGAEQSISSSLKKLTIFFIPVSESIRRIGSSAFSPVSGEKAIPRPAFSSNRLRSAISNWDSIDSPSESRLK